MKPRIHLKGPIASALGSAFAGKNPESVVRGFALHLHTSVWDGGGFPPFSPFTYAEWLGLGVERSDIAAEGILADWPGRNCRILLRASATDEGVALRRRENFTVAHEIGHFLIRKELDGFVPEAIFCRTNNDEERLCNYFAEELLMPSYRVVDDLMRCEGRPLAIMALANAYDVSLKAMLCRMSRALREPVFGVIWKMMENRYEVKWATPSRFKGLVLCNTGETTVERAFGAEGEIEGRDSIILNGDRMRWPCVSVRLSGNQVLSIGARLSRSALWHKKVERDFPRPHPEEPVQLMLPLARPKGERSGQTKAPKSNGVRHSQRVVDRKVG